MNRKELATTLGVSPTAIGHWEKEGMPTITKGGKGSPNEYSLDDCLVWLRKTGKGQSIRADRPGATTRVNAMMQFAGGNDAPSESQHLTLTEKQIEKAITFGETQATLSTLHWVAENFLIAAASLIRFGGFDPESAVHQGFHIAYAFESACCMAHNIEPLPHDPQSRVARWLSLDKQAVAEFAALAVEMQKLWGDEKEEQPVA